MIERGASVSAHFAAIPGGRLHRLVAEGEIPLPLQIELLARGNCFSNKYGSWRRHQPGFAPDLSRLARQRLRCATRDLGPCTRLHFLACKRASSTHCRGMAVPTRLGPSEGSCSQAFARSQISAPVPVSEIKKSDTPTAGRRSGF